MPYKKLENGENKLGYLGVVLFVVVLATVIFLLVYVLLHDLPQFVQILALFGLLDWLGGCQNVDRLA